VNRRPAVCPCHCLFEDALRCHVNGALGRCLREKHADLASAEWTLLQSRCHRHTSPEPVFHQAALAGRRAAICGYHFRVTPPSPLPGDPSIACYSRRRCSGVLSPAHKCAHAQSLPPPRTCLLCAVSSLLWSLMRRYRAISRYSCSQRQRRQKARERTGRARGHQAKEIRWNRRSPGSLRP
jgi:hypothetical protein